MTKLIKVVLQSGGGPPFLILLVNWCISNALGFFKDIASKLIDDQDT